MGKLMPVTTGLWQPIPSPFTTKLQPHTWHSKRKRNYLLTSSLTLWFSSGKQALKAFYFTLNIGERPIEERCIKDIYFGLFASDSWELLAMSQIFNTCDQWVLQRWMRIISGGDRSGLRGSMSLTTHLCPPPQPHSTQSIRGKQLQ